MYHLTEPELPRTIQLPVTLTGEQWAQLAHVAQREKFDKDNAANMGWALSVAATSKFTFEEYADKIEVAR